MTVEIQSPQNPHFRMLLSLLTSKGLKKEKLFILSGKKLVQEALKSHAKNIVAELVAPKMSFVSTADQKTVLATGLFQQLDELGTNFNLLVLKQDLPPIWKIQDHKKGLWVFCPLGDPSNVGALLRSCEAFAVDGVVLLAEAANPYLPKAVKASSGSVLRQKLYSGPSIKDLGKLCDKLILLDQNGVSLPDFKWPTLSLLVVGEEGPGQNASLPGTRLSIPTSGVESLNATVATSLALYEYRRQRGLP